MINFIKGLFKKPDEEVISYLKPEDIKIEDNHIDIPVISVSNNCNYNDRPLILLMDDYPGVISLLHDDMKYTDKEYKDKYCFLESTGNFAAFSVIDYLQREDHKKIDIAFLDITLGGIIVKNGKVTEYDGVDVAIGILKDNPDAKIKFITGHTINRKNPELFKFITKFETFTGKEIDSFVIPKNASRIDSIAEVLFKNVR